MGHSYCKKPIEKPVFEKGTADWCSETSLFKKYNNATHHSIKLTPCQASMNVIEKKSNQIFRTKEQNLN